MTTQAKHKPNWGLIIQLSTIAIAAIIAFTTVQVSVAALTERVEKVETRQENYSDSITDLSISIGRLEERIISLQESVNRIENSLED